MKSSSSCRIKLFGVNLYQPLPPFRPCQINIPHAYLSNSNHKDKRHSEGAYKFSFTRDMLCRFLFFKMNTWHLITFITNTTTKLEHGIDQHIFPGQQPMLSNPANIRRPYLILSVRHSMPLKTNLHAPNIPFATYICRVVLFSLSISRL